MTSLAKKTNDIVGWYLKDDEISKQYISSNLAKKEDDTTGQYQV